MQYKIKRIFIYFYFKKEEEFKNFKNFFFYSIKIINNKIKIKIFYNIENFIFILQ